MTLRCPCSTDSRKPVERRARRPDDEEDPVDAQSVGEVVGRRLLQGDEGSTPAREPQGLLHQGATDGVHDDVERAGLAGRRRGIRDRRPRRRRRVRAPRTKSRSRSMAVAVTCAPSRSASCTANDPTPPAAPRTSTRSPCATWAWSARACHAVSPASGSAAASTCDSEAGLVATNSGGTLTYSRGGTVTVEGHHPEDRVAGLQTGARWSLLDDTRPLVRGDDRGAVLTVPRPRLVPEQLVERDGRRVHLDQHERRRRCGPRHPAPPGAARDLLDGGRRSAVMSGTALSASSRWPRRSSRTRWRRPGCTAMRLSGSVE